ncbi:PIG-P domain-containing protein [Pyricularia oryzae]|nr:PIG-P domain-containing protein [Pyricularia oryzae]
MALNSDDDSDDDELIYQHTSSDEHGSPSDDDDDDDAGRDGSGEVHTPTFTHNFAPPYYGRPPTPLPPSPSLTSLLRPSRPNTPDASDDELEPVPRATPQVPTYEYYGFVLYVLSWVALLIYLLWAFLPSPVLHAVGIYYYPSRWWALAVPGFLVMLIVYIYVALALYNTEFLTLRLESIETVVDTAGKIAAVDARGRLRPRTDGLGAGKWATGAPGGGLGIQGGNDEDDGVTTPGGIDWRSIWNEGTDAVMDVPLAGVNEILYGYRHGDDESVNHVG